jgi:ABC-type multidrug transport system ATPase subunit
LNVLGGKAGKTVLGAQLKGELEVSSKKDLALYEEPKRGFFDKSNNSLTFAAGAWPFTKCLDLVSIVEQYDVFTNNLSVMEHLQFHAGLRLLGSNAEARKQQIESILKRLRLEDCRDVRVPMLSGGQKKRVSIAEELLNNPSILLLDEPTSGLDSTVAREVVEILFGLDAIPADTDASGHCGDEKDLEQGQLEGNKHEATQLSTVECATTIIFTIHQPSSLVYTYFKNVMFLGQGQVMYFGAAKDVTSRLFEWTGERCPEHYNGAEFALDVMQSEETVKKIAAGMRQLQQITDGTSPSDPTVEENTESPPPSTDSSLDVLEDGSELRKARASWFAEFTLIFWRTATDRLRNRLNTKIAIWTNIFVMFVIGAIYWQLGNNIKSIVARNGAILILVTFPLFSETFNAAIPLVESIPSIQREYTTKRLYRLSSFFWARTTGEIPIGLVNPVIFGVTSFFLFGFFPDFSFSKFAELVGLLVLAQQTSQSLGYFAGSLSVDFARLVMYIVCIMVPMMSLSPLFNPSYIPSWISWLQYLSVFNWVGRTLIIWAWKDFELVWQGDAPSILEIRQYFQYIVSVAPTENFFCDDVPSVQFTNATSAADRCRAYAEGAIKGDAAAENCFHGHCSMKVFGNAYMRDVLDMDVEQNPRLLTDAVLVCVACIVICRLLAWAFFTFRYRYNNSFRVLWTGCCGRSIKRS